MSHWLGNALMVKQARNHLEVMVRPKGSRELLRDEVNPGLNPHNSHYPLSSEVRGLCTETSRIRQLP